MGGSPGVPYFRAQFATVGHGEALSAGSSTHFGRGEFGSGGRVVEFAGCDTHALECSRLGGCPGMRGSQIPVGSLFGQLPGFAEHERNSRPPDLKFG